MPVLAMHILPAINGKIACNNTLWAALLLLLLWATNTNTFAQQRISKAHQVQALFLYNFTQFVEWPAGSFSGDGAPLIIGILGDDPFGAYIDELVRGEVINGHPLKVERFAALDDITHCHILYINFPEKEKRAEALASLKSMPVLTVSDKDGFAKMGGVIRFVNERGRIGIRVNIGVAASSNLLISSKLLRLSEIVTSKNN